MDLRSNLWRAAVRWPLLVLAVAVPGIVVAAALDQTAGVVRYVVQRTWSSAAGAARRPVRSHLAGADPWVGLPAQRHNRTPSTGAGRRSAGR
jgi:hypothetical protein